MAHAEQEKAYAEAMKEYHDEQKKTESERKSRKAICRDVAEKWKAMRKPVTVSADTLRQRLEGGWTCGQFNAEQNAWLSPEEEESVVAYCIKLRNRGFPLNHSRLKFHVDMLLQARLQSNFPEYGVGKNWTE
ncbi:uncharacterized protein F5891DRAFT_960371 [Suillus fuscotomentosus]|uniref:HTH CENPB-type domain-containing protein n=1 Tax=Suillus fuscotomentosus TaxID=1912939 RepID=A0AAD4HF22_9AGAM|nr:uncharacterized protein F5891DRAFT_960371 [Suillus fuscotomentosus]KAG1895260.1 hypothetical protein F5891DRAFT_960371 [Suillus fuscotomentosus]